MILTVNDLIYLKEDVLNLMMNTRFVLTSLGLIGLIVIFLPAGPAFAPYHKIQTPMSVSTEISESLASFYSIDVSQEKIEIMWLGNHQKGSLEGHASAGIIIKTANNVILIDPASLLSDNIDSLQKVDAVFITHEHGDHFNADSTVAIQQKTGALIVANPAAYSILNDKIPENALKEILPNEKKTFLGITVDAFLAEHPVEEPLLYVIEIDGFRIFHGSDSAFVEDLTKIESPVDIAFVPVGDPSPTASPNDAFEMTKTTQASIVVPMHGSPEQLKIFRDLVEKSDLKTEVIIPKQLEKIIPSIEKVKEPQIPEWIRNNAKWWSEGNIGDSDFTGGIQYMIKENIISIPDLPMQASETLEEKIPNWVRNNAGWWANGLISDDDFVSGIKYLVEQGIIRV